MSTINLLPDDYLRKRAQRRANILCLALFGAVMVGVVLAALHSEQNNGALEDRRREISRQYEQTQKVIETMRQMEQKKQELTAKAADTASLMERVPRSYLLGLVTRVCPENITLERFELSTHILTPGEAGARFDQVTSNNADANLRVEITLAGYVQSGTVEDVGKYLYTLGRSPIVARADLDTTRNLSDDTMVVREFKFKLYLVPNADVMDFIAAATSPVESALPPAPLASRGRPGDARRAGRSTP